MHGSRSGSVGNEKVLHNLRETKTSTLSNGVAMHNKGIDNRVMEGHDSAKPNELISGVNAMHVEEKPLSPSLMEHKTEGKERVSFDTNMSTVEEVPESGLGAKEGKQLTTTIERFHARKFGAKLGGSTDKRAMLKVSSSGGVKKQKNPNKSFM